MWSWNSNTDILNTFSLQTVTCDPASQPPWAHRRSSWGERSAQWQWLLLWEFAPAPATKTPEGRAAGQSATPPPPPGPLPWNLAGREGAQDQGLPLHKHRQGRGSSEELTQSFHPREAHFRGMQPLLYLDRGSSMGPCVAVLNPGSPGLFPSDPLLFSLGPLHLHTQPGLTRLLCGKSRPRQLTQCFVTIQTPAYTVSSREKEGTWVRDSIPECSAVTLPTFDFWNEVGVWYRPALRKSTMTSHAQIKLPVLFNHWNTYTVSIWACWTQ